MVGIDEISIRRTLTAFIFLILAVLSFLLIKPVLMAIVVALILAFVFSPVYDWLLKRIKSPNLTVSMIIAFVLVIIVLPLWFLTPILIKQSFKIFQATQQIDFVTPLQNIFPSLFATEQFSSEIGGIISSFTSNAANYVVNFFARLLLDFPKLSLQLVVVLFTFFYVLRDKEKVLKYISGLSPFSKDVERKFAYYSKGISSSVIYGQVIVGIIQGIIVGIGLFVFGISNALFLTLLAALAGIFPIIGTALVWIPVMIYLIIAGNNVSAIGIFIFGIFSSTIDNFLRPMIVSRRTDLHTAVVIVGMIGGIFMFGILGVILGPLILAYLIIIIELYRKKDIPDSLIKEEK